MTTGLCPCGSDQLLDCCRGPVIGGAQAKSAEALMRSRYSAYVLGYWLYLRESWHPDTRPSTVTPVDTDWIGLTIVKATTDTVEFIAGFRDGGKVMALHEISRFAQISGHWRYLDGICDVQEAGRNSPCPCGGIKKTKRCCGSL